MSRALIGLALLVLAYAGFFSIGGSCAHYPISGSQRDLTRSQIRGAYHLHSTASDGQGTEEEIARAAKLAGLQFLITTDHNLETLPAPHFQGGVLVIPGVELSTPAGHLTAIGIPRGLTESERGSEPIRRVRELGGISFLAHPFQRKRPWTDWTSAWEANGLEVYSADSMLRAARGHLLTQLLPAVGAYLANPIHGLMMVVEAQPEATAKLLELSARGPKVAMCAHDAHGLPSYESEFRTLAIYLPEGPDLGPPLTPDAQKAAKQVISDLSLGAAYCVFHGLADAPHFRIEGLDMRSREAKLGSRLRVVVPDTAPPFVRLQIYGPARLDADGRTLLLERTGAVQIEVWALGPGKLWGGEWKPWIIPSPIRVTP